MSEQVLQGFVAATGDPPEEPTAPNFNSMGLYIAFQFPNRNDFIDPDGLPQPTVPPAEIMTIETRFTYDETAETDPFDDTIVWTKHQKHLTLGATAKLQDPNQDFDSDTNDWEGLKGHIAIRPLLIKKKIYFQSRSVTRSGIPSEWTDVVRLTVDDQYLEPEKKRVEQDLTLLWRTEGTGQQFIEVVTDLELIWRVDTDEVFGEIIFDLFVNLELIWRVLDEENLDRIDCEETNLNGIFTESSIQGKFLNINEELR